MLQGPAAVEIVEALERIYARPELAPPRRGLLYRVLELWEAFKVWLASLLRGWLPEAWHPAFSWVILGLVLAAVVWAIIAIARSFGGRPQRGAAATANGALLPRGDAAQWEALARAAAVEGRFRDAALALYRAALLRLEARGLIRYHPSRTPGDYRRALPQGAPERRSFDVFVRRLLPLAFAAREPDRSAWDELCSAAAELGVHG